MFVFNVIIYSILIIIIFYIFAFLLILSRKVYFLHKVHGPGRTFLLGVLLELNCDEVSLFNKVRIWSLKYGPFYRISASFMFPCCNISGPEEMEKVVSTTKNIEKAPVYNFLLRWLGEGLLTSKDSKWHTRRKILTPAFHFNILQQFVTIFNNETKRLVKVLKKETDKPWTNVVPHISQFTLYSITETSMGVTLNLESKDDKNYVAAIYQLGKILTYRVKRPWRFFNVIFYNLNPVGWKEIKLLKILHSFTQNIISIKSKDFEKFDVPNDEFNYSKSKKLAFLDLLLNAKLTNGIIDDEGIKDEVNTFMFEGHDTTSSSICFTLMLLANHKRYQEQIYEEIITVLGDHDKDPDLNDLNEMKLMERFIKESLRLYPSVPFIARTIEEDMIIDGCQIPKRTMINIHIYDIHRNPNYWSDPYKFDPDRFLPENCVGRHPYAFVPFSAGPRNCIGQRFAMLELKAVVCEILRNFILEPIDTPETIQMKIDLILRTSDDSLKVKICQRNSRK